MLSHSIENRPAVIRPIPSHYGREPVHQNDVLRHRAKARRLWAYIARRPSAPHFAPAHRSARIQDSGEV